MGLNPKIVWQANQAVASAERVIDEQTFSRCPKVDNVGFCLSMIGMGLCQQHHTRDWCPCQEYSALRWACLISIASDPPAYLVDYGNHVVVRH